MSTNDDLHKTVTTSKMVELQRAKKRDDAVTRLREQINEKERASREVLEQRYSSGKSNSAAS